MSKAVRGVASAFVSLTLGLVMTSAAYGQGGTTSTLSGIAVDSSGAVLPGADVTVSMPATGFTQSASTNSEGAFSFPGLNIGTYTVTIKLSGFKTFVSKDVVLTSGVGANVRAMLELGGVEEQVIVSSASEIVQTQTSTISSTINTNQITKLPLTTRSAMDFVVFMPGVSTAGGNRDSTINGLPQSAINITLDGVNIQDNTNKSTDGFFAIVSPRLDAIEEVTVTTAAQGADGAGQGAVQIKFVTRSGTNTLSGSAYEYYRNDKLNANTWFNNRDGVAKAALLQHQYGGRVGGPIVIPGVFDGRNRAFFFVNYEELKQPSDTTRTRRLLNADAVRGIFRYPGGQPVDLLALAAANGHVSTVDPTISALLRDIRSAASSGGSLTDIDPNLQEYRFNVPVESIRRFPTVRVDYNITSAHRFSSAYNYNWFMDAPDTLNNSEVSFPGFPVQAGQNSTRLAWSNSVRSTLRQNLVNEARVGFSSSPVTFFGELSPAMYGGTSVANQGGFRFAFPTIGSALQSPGRTPTPSSRDASDLVIENTLTWLKGRHNLSLGTSWTQYDIWLKNQTLVPQISFNEVTGDPAGTMFNGTNFPGASNPNLTAAQRLYNLLVGRVSEIAGNAGLNEDTGQYEYLGLRTQRGRLREVGFFVQDAWRLRPNLTINAGVRYDVQYPFAPLNNSYSTASLEDLCGVSGTNPQSVCNLFQAGVTPGRKPQFVNFGKGSPAYTTDYDNIAPSVGAAWTVRGGDNFFGRLIGQDGDSVIRGGYTRSFNRNGLGDFTGQFGGNPGVTLTTNRNASLTNLGTLPVLLRETSRLGPPAFASTPIYPMTDVVTEDVNLFDPNIKVPYADSYTIGFQRTLTRSMAVEVRYVGTRSRANWETLNYNEVNIFDNGFINEFRQAQANLQAHVASGCGGSANPCSFAYRGPGTGTAPLPTLLAFLNSPTQTPYSGGNWTSATFLAFLAARNPNPFGMVQNNNDTGLMNNGTLRANAAANGLAANFFLANPDALGGADLTVNKSTSDYNALQLEVRRRLSRGLQFQTSYVFGKAYASQFETFRRPIFSTQDTGAEGNVVHGFKANVVYDLPFGQGRRFGSGANAVTDRIIGGWTVGLTSRIQSGRLVAFGNVRLVGMSVDDVQKMFKLQFDDAGKVVFNLPREVIDETLKAWNVSATSANGYSGAAPTGRYFAPPNGPDCIEVDNGEDYGDCGTRELVVTGPLFQQHDISVAKRIRLLGRSDFEFRVEMLNAFNQANFAPVAGVGNTVLNEFRVTGLTGANTSRVMQLVARINW
jgi:uncharacterized membrane protein